MLPLFMRVFVSVFGVGSLALVCLCLTAIPSFGNINEFLQEEATKLKVQYRYGSDDHRLETLLQWISPMEPPQTNAAGLHSFNQAVSELLRFFVELNPYEQMAFFNLIEVYSRYQGECRSFNIWFDRIKSYQPLFISRSRVETLEVSLSYFQEIPREIWQRAYFDPSLMLRILTQSPFEGLLKSFHQYWSTLLLWKETNKFPSWALFQEEMTDIRNWYAVEHGRDEEPLFVWMGRFNEDVRRRLDDLKIRLLSLPAEWDIRDKGLELDIEGSFITRLPAHEFSALAFEDKEGFFRRIFPWNVHRSSYDEDEEMLSVQLLLQTGNVFDLNFSVLEERGENAAKLYFTLDIPTLSEINAVLSNWELICEVKPHQKFRDLSVLRLQSVTSLRWEWARSKLYIDESKDRLRKELPQKLQDLKSYLDSLFSVREAAVQESTARESATRESDQ